MQVFRPFCLKNTPPVAWILQQTMPPSLSNLFIKSLLRDLAGTFQPLKMHGTCLSFHEWRPRNANAGQVPGVCRRGK
jgi:hypothetical protein